MNRFIISSFMLFLRAVKPLHSTFPPRTHSKKVSPLSGSYSTYTHPALFWSYLHLPYLLLREKTDFDITWRPQIQCRSSLTIPEINLFVFKVSTVASIRCEVLPFQGPQNVLSVVIQIISSSSLLCKKVWIK